MNLSGCHRTEGRYLTVAAAVAARITSTRVASVDGIGLAKGTGEPTLVGRLGREFKYVESIAERETVAIAHHAASVARTLLI